MRFSIQTGANTMEIHGKCCKYHGNERFYIGQGVGDHTIGGGASEPGTGIIYPPSSRSLVMGPS